MKWIAEFQKANPKVKINYQSIGSGGGIRQITERTVDFGATDAPMTDEQLEKAAGILHIPTCLGAVVADLQPRGRRVRPEADAGGGRAHLPGQDQEVERPGASRRRTRT